MRKRGFCFSSASSSGRYTISSSLRLLWTSRIGMGSALSAAYSAMPLRGVIPMPPASRTAGRVSCSTKSPIGPKTRTSSPDLRATNARLYGESETRTAYSRCGRVGLVASDMARVHALLGLQLEERELGRTECEGLRFLHLNGVGGRRERSRGHDSSPEAPRGTGQPLDLQCALGPERDCGIS